MTPQTNSILLLIIQNMPSTKPNVFMLGIENSGKTQFFQSLFGNSNDPVILEMCCADQDYCGFLIKDPIEEELFGENREINYLSADCIIFVISLLDFPDRIDEVRQALLEASANTGDKPFTIVINQQDSSCYDVAEREDYAKYNIILWLMDLKHYRRYKFLWCDVKVEKDVKGCFDQIAEFYFETRFQGSKTVVLCRL